MAGKTGFSVSSNCLDHHENQWNHRDNEKVSDKAELVVEVFGWTPPKITDANLFNINI